MDKKKEKVLSRTQVLRKIFLIPSLFPVYLKYIHTLYISNISICCDQLAAPGNHLSVTLFSNKRTFMLSQYILGLLFPCITWKSLYHFQHHSSYTFFKLTGKAAHYRKKIKKLFLLQVRSKSNLQWIKTSE